MVSDIGVWNKKNGGRYISRSDSKQMAGKRKRVKGSRTEWQNNSMVTDGGRHK